MNAAQLLKHFARVAEAPEAVPRLRRFILDLAVRGKLVEQDPRDEPASVLLRHTVDTSEESRVRDPHPPDQQRSLPSGWTSAPLARIVAVLNGRAYAKSELLDSGTPVLRVGNLFTSNHWYYSDLSLDAGKYCDKGDLLYAWSASFGPFIWSGPKAIFHYHIWKLEPLRPGDMNKRYLYHFLAQKTREIKESGHGISMLHMTKEKMERIAVPVPPLAEQRRIVARVDDLMALCDQLEAAQTEREARRDRVVAASLYRLNESAPADAQSFRDHARLYLNHLPRLATRPEHIQQLRRTILNLAVRGRLVPQDPGDEPASDLLRRVSSAGHQGATRKTSRSLEATTSAAREDVPHEIPNSWIWSNTQNLAQPGQTITYGILKPVWVETGVPTVRVTEMRTGVIDFDALPNCEERRAARFAKTRLSEGDLLISKDGTIGRTAFVPPALIGGNITQHVLRFPISPLLNRRFVRVCVDAPPCQAWMAGETKGVALQGVNVGDFRRMPIPIPPLAEQHRIVARVDELMALCDRLAAQLASTQAESGRLLEAVLHQVLSPVA